MKTVWTAIAWHFQRRRGWMFRVFGGLGAWSSSCGRLVAGYRFGSGVRFKYECDGIKGTIERSL